MKSGAMESDTSLERGGIDASGWLKTPLRRAQIEVTNRCNLRCVMCPLSDPDYRPPGGYRHLSLSYFSQILDHLGSTLEAVSLQGLGEPLLNPGLSALVAEAVSRGIDVSFVTNGLLLTEEKAKDLIEAGLHRIIFSIDGSTEATYRHIRRGGSLDQLFQNLQGLMALKARLASDRPEVGVMTVALKDNQEEIPAIVERVASFGVLDVTVKHILEGAGCEDEAKGLTHSEVQRLRKALLSVVKRTGARVTLPSGALSNEPSTRTCQWPFEAVYVKANGEVGPCCFGYDEVHSNAFQDSGDAIWNSAPLRMFRETFVARVPDLCLRCPAYSLRMERLDGCHEEGGAAS